MKKKWDEFSNMLKKVWDAFSDTFVANLVLVFPLLYIVCNTWSVVIFHKELQKRGTVLPTKGYVKELMISNRGGRFGNLPFALLVEQKEVLDTVFVSDFSFGYYSSIERCSQPLQGSVNLVFSEENPDRVIFEKDIMYPGAVMFDTQCPLPPYRGLWRRVLWITFLIINIIGWVYTYLKVKKENEIVVSDEK